MPTKLPLVTLFLPLTLLSASCGQNTEQVTGHLIIGTRNYIKKDSKYNEYNKPSGTMEFKKAKVTLSDIRLDGKEILNELTIDPLKKGEKRVGILYSPESEVDVHNNVMLDVLKVIPAPDLPTGIWSIVKNKPTSDQKLTFKVKSIKAEFIYRFNEEFKQYRNMEKADVTIDVSFDQANFSCTAFSPNYLWTDPEKEPVLSFDSHGIFRWIDRLYDVGQQDENGNYLKSVTVNDSTKVPNEKTKAEHLLTNSAYVDSSAPYLCYLE